MCFFNSHDMYMCGHERLHLRLPFGKQTLHPFRTNEASHAKCLSALAHTLTHVAHAPELAEIPTRSQTAPAAPVISEPGDFGESTRPGWEHALGRTFLKTMRRWSSSVICSSYQKLLHRVVACRAIVRPLRREAVANMMMHSFKMGGK